MLELGALTKEMHVKIGYESAKYGFRNIFAFGEFADYIAYGATIAGARTTAIHIFGGEDSFFSLASEIYNKAEENEIILIKASHALNAKKIIEILESMSNNAG